MEQLKCPNCGGNVDRERMICPYCGTQFKREYDTNLIRVETYNPQVETLSGKIMLDESFVNSVGIEEASKMAVHELARRLADNLAPYMELHTQNDYQHLGVAIYARARILRPDYRF